MEAKHTPGPWTLVEINSETVKGAVHVYGGGAPITTDVWGPTLAESDANARLIAAAPDLLAALEAAERRLTACARAFYGDGKRSSLAAAFEGWKVDIEPARAAIAKATGGAR